MKTSDLLLSGLHITEDNYHYKGLFFLSNKDVSVQVDLEDLMHDKTVEQLKDKFQLEECVQEIRKILMERVIDKANISSKITEGEKYEEKVGRTNIEKAADALDLA
ncbi:MAG: hypothetical protein ACOX7R_08815 [Acetivibrionales bacterium]|jgi:glycosylphosphatidylinositol transamidase (GPIT) subunit GPI8